MKCQTLWLALFVRLVLASYRPDRVSSYGEDGTNITCVGKWTRRMIRFRTGLHPITSLAHACYQLAEIRCHPFKDQEGNIIDIVDSEPIPDFRVATDDDGQHSSLYTSPLGLGRYVPFIGGLQRSFRLKDYCRNKCICGSVGQAEIDRGRFGEDRPFPDEYGHPVYSVSVDFGKLHKIAMDFTPKPQTSLALHLDWGAYFPIYVNPSPLSRARCMNAEIPGWLQASLVQLTGKFFEQNTQLCLHRYFGGIKSWNAGGICAAYGGEDTRRLRFDYEHRAPIFTADVEATSSLQMLSLGRNVITYCRAVCACPLQDGTDPYFPTDVAIITQQQVLEAARHYSFEDQNIVEVEEAADALAIIQDAPSAGIVPSKLQCEVTGKPCTAVVGSGSCPDKCLCRAERQRLVPNTNVFTFIGSCIAVSAVQGSRSRLRLNPRDDTLDGETSSLCPCNATYVSQACCKSKDGIIWEPAHMKLGEIVL